MIISAKEASTISLVGITQQLNKTIVEAAEKGTYYVWLGAHPDLEVALAHHPEKENVVNNLRLLGYKVYNTHSGSLRISWE